MTAFFSPVKSVFKGWYLLLTFIVGLLYLILPALLANLRLITLTLYGPQTQLYKAQLITAVLFDPLTILPPLDLFFTIATALLLSMNLSLLVQIITVLKKQKSLTLAVGGSSTIALVGAGCASCGISILSIIGVSGAFLPFHGIWYNMFSIALLSLSLLVILKNKAAACKAT